MSRLAEVSSRRRQRELAGDRRAGRYPRALARRRQYDFLRGSWRLLAFGGGVLVAIPVLVTWFFIEQPFLQGLFLGASLATIVASLWSLVVQASGTANPMMGDQGEQWTAQELRKLRRRGWRVVNHVMLREWGDIDHVLVGPGGVYAIETKWSAEDWAAEHHQEWARAAAKAVTESARSLRLWLRAQGVMTVQPVVFVWGRASRELRPRMLGSATVMSARYVKAWRSDLTDDQLSAAQIEAIWRKLDQHCRQRDLREAEDTPLLPSIAEVVGRVVACVVLASVGFVVAAELSRPLGGELAWFGACVGQILLAVVAMRVLRRIQVFAWSWIAGVMLVLLWAAWLWLRYWFR